MKSTSGAFDQNWESSIKVGERTRRGSSSLLEVHIHGPSPQAVGQIHRKSPKQGQPVRFRYNNDVPPRQGEYGNWQGRWANGVHHKHNLWRPGRAKVYHKEADFRLLLHAKYATQSSSRIIIQSPDTDVLVLCASHFGAIAWDELWFTTGVRDYLSYHQCM